MATNAKKFPRNSKSRQQNELFSMVSDLVGRLSLANIAGLQFGGDRDLYDVLGWKRVLKTEDYHAMWKRNGLAQRIINAYPQATWRRNPVITEQEEAAETKFERGIKDLNKRLGLWHYCKRADTLAGLGRYSLLVLGANDSGDMAQELTRATELLWLLPISEYNASIKSWEKNLKNPRFGQPVSYNITMGSELTNTTGRAQSTQEVHHSRVIHIAEGCIQDDVYGTPRLESIFNNLFDTEKVVGGSAEMFWLGARQGLQFEANEDSQLTTDDIDDMEDMVQEYHHKLRRMLASEGGKFAPLASETPDPAGNFDVQLKIISGATGIPQRILVGNEAGDLASTTDENSWLSRVDERRIDYAEPRIIRKAIQRFIEIGILDPPSASIGDDYLIEWPSNLELGEAARAEIASKKATALTSYANSLDAPSIVTREEFREEFLGLPPEPPGGFPEEDNSLDQDLADALNPPDETVPGDSQNAA